MPLLATLLLWLDRTTHCSKGSLYQATPKDTMNSFAKINEQETDLSNHHFQMKREILVLDLPSVSDSISYRFFKCGSYNNDVRTKYDLTKVALFTQY